MSVEELRVKRIGLTEHLKSIKSDPSKYGDFRSRVYSFLLSSALPPAPPSASSSASSSAPSYAPPSAPPSAPSSAMPPIPPLVPSSSAMPPAPSSAPSDMNIQLMKFLVENENTPEQAQFFDVISNIGIDRNVGMQDAVNQPLPYDMDLEDEDLGGGKQKQKRRRTIKRKYRRSIAV